jgi:hypothetical protein
MSLHSYILITNDRNKYQCQVLGINTLDFDLQSEYDLFEDLPKQIQQKIAVLELIDDRSELIGIGRRLGKDWIIHS